MIDPRERALDIVMTKDVSAGDIENAIVEAIEEEREACARVADDLEYDRHFEFGWQKVADSIADKIRARSNET